MMLVQGDREIYFIDRDNSVFQVNGLTFPHPRDVSRCLRDTLMDGVSSFINNLFPGGIVEKLRFLCTVCVQNFNLPLTKLYQLTGDGDR